jgi:hypothetical protein
MPKKRGLTRLRRCANTVLRSLPLHSTRRWPGAAGTCTENDMSDGAVATPSSANKAMSCG